MKLRGFDREGERRLSCPTRLLIASGAITGFTLFMSPSAHAEDTVSTSSSSDSGQQTQTSTDQANSGSSESQGQSSTSSSSSPSLSSLTVDPNNTTLTDKLEQVNAVLQIANVTSTTTSQTAQSEASDVTTATETQAQAQTTLDSANTALSSATQASTDASTALTTAQSANTDAQTALSTQQAITDSAQQTATTAQAAADAANTSTTVTETFDGSTTHVVTVTSGSGVTIGGNWNTPQTSGSALVVQWPANDITIDVNPSNTGAVTSVTLGVYAKNGDTTMTVTNMDGSTTTSTLHDDVNPSTQAVGYTSSETVTGTSIDTIKIAKDNDYYIIDNIRITRTSSDPALVQAALDAQQTLASAQQTLTTLQASATVTTHDLYLAQQAVDTAQANLTAAAQAAASATSAKAAADANVTVQTKEADLAIANAQVEASASAITVVQSQLDTLKNTPLNPAATVTNALDTAQTKIDDAVSAIAAADAKKIQADTYQAAAGENTTVASATSNVTQKTTELATAEAAVDSQTVVVVSAQALKDEAQTVVNASTQQGLKVEVYSVAGQNAAPTLPANATPVLTTVDTNGINESWGSGNVAGSSYRDDVIVKYSGTWTPTTTGTQYIYTPADDGTKLYLDGTLVSNAWVDKGGGGPTIDVPTVAGLGKAFEFWYYENGGGAFVQFMRYTGSGWEVVPGTEFSISSATQEQKDALSSAVATLNAETQTLTTLQAQEDAASTALASAQATLVLAQSAETARTEYVALAQTAIDKTVDAYLSVQVASTVVAQEVINQMPIDAPTDVVATQTGSTVHVSWTAPTQNTAPERYAISWTLNGSGWGIATGNVGDSNALNTSIDISTDLFKTTGGLDKTYEISVRSDNDTLGKYSTVASTTLLVKDPTPPTPPQTPPSPEPPHEQPGDQGTQQGDQTGSQSDQTTGSDSSSSSSDDSSSANDNTDTGSGDDGSIIPQDPGTDNTGSDDSSSTDSGDSGDSSNTDSGSGTDTTPTPDPTPAPTPDKTPEPTKTDTTPITKEEAKSFAEATGVTPNSPDQLSDTVVKEAPKEALVPHVQVDKPGVENGGIEFFGTKSQPQVVGEDGKLTPPPPPPGSGLPIPPDAITTTDTFIGQPGGTTFNAPDIAVPVIPKFVCKTVTKEDGTDVHIDIDGNEHPIEQCTFLPAALDAIPGAGAAVQAMGQAYAALANIGNDMSPITRKKAKKILVATLVVGQIAALRRRFGA